MLPSELDAKLDASASDTIYMSVVDKEGNIVSLIQSNYSGVRDGHGRAPGRASRCTIAAAVFELEPRQAELARRAQASAAHDHSGVHAARAIMRSAFGIMGGWNQSQAHAQFVSNVVDFGMNVQMALEAARFRKLGFSGCKVAIENGVAPEVIEGLRKQGHVVPVELRYSQTMGRGQCCGAP